MSLRDVIIVGAGPAGLATAIALKQAGVDYIVLERGTLVDAIARFPINMVFFTTPELLEIGGLPLTTPYEKPTRVEALRYYRKVVDAYDLNVVLHEEVVGVSEGATGGEGTTGAEGSTGAESSTGWEHSSRASRTFEVVSRARAGSSRATDRVRTARAVVLAMGYYGLPNLLDVPGEGLPHVSHYYTEAHRYFRERVVIVGGKNSACEAALELHRAGAHVTLVHRGPALGDSVKYWVKPDIENRIAEGSIAAKFNTRVVEIRPTEVIVRANGSASDRAPDALSGDDGASTSIPADSVLLLTGYRADEDFLRRAGVTIDPQSRQPSHDPETFETNVPGLFIAGGQLAGKRTGSIFIENGRFHGERIARVLADRLGARGRG